MYFVIKNDTATRIAEGEYTYLEDTLSEVNSFFGVSIIPLEEWFDPSMQVYLAMLINRKLMPSNFEHERTLLFFSNRESKNATVPLMDENHYGRCLAHIHRDCEIPLSFLNRDEIFRILKSLSKDEKEVLGCYPRWTNWRITHLLRVNRIPLRWLRRRIPQLVFALVGKGEDPQAVFRVSKDGTDDHIAQTIE